MDIVSTLIASNRKLEEQVFELTRQVKALTKQLKQYEVKNFSNSYEASENQTRKRIDQNLQQAFLAIEEQLAMSKLHLRIHRVILVNTTNQAYERPKGFIEYNHRAEKAISLEKALYVKDSNFISDTKYHNIREEFQLWEVLPDLRSLVAFRSKLNNQLRLDIVQLSSVCYFTDVKKKYKTSAFDSFQVCY